MRKKVIEMATKKLKVGNVPNLRFGEFEGEWEKKKLGDMIEFKAGYAFKSEYMLAKKSAYQLIKMSNVYQNELRLDRNPSFWPIIDFKQNEFLLKKGDTVLTLTGTVGKQDFGYSVQIKEDNRYLLNQRLVLLREKRNKSTNDFINQLVSNKKFLCAFFGESKGGTGNQTNVGIDDVKNISFFFPSFFEQQKIASFLSLIDERISTQNKIIGELKLLKSTLSKKIFAWQVRFKNDRGNDFPKWEMKKLGDMCEKKSSNISANKIEDNFGEYIIYGASGILKNVDFYEEKNDYISIVKDGAGVGRLFYCKGKSSVLGTMDIIKPQTTTNTYFLFCLLSTIDFTKYVTGSTIPHIYFKDYKNENCGIPSVEEQSKIANFLSSIDEKIDTETKLLRQLENQKKYLLTNLFI